MNKAKRESKCRNLKERRVILSNLLCNLAENNIKSHLFLSLGEEDRQKPANVLVTNIHFEEGARAEKT